MEWMTQWKEALEAAVPGVQSLDSGVRLPGEGRFPHLCNEGNVKTCLTGHFGYKKQSVKTSSHFHRCQAVAPSAQQLGCLY